METPNHSCDFALLFLKPCACSGWARHHDSQCCHLQFITTTTANTDRVPTLWRALPRRLPGLCRSFCQAGLPRPLLLKTHLSPPPVLTGGPGGAGSQVGRKISFLMKKKKIPKRRFKTTREKEKHLLNVISVFETVEFFQLEPTPPRAHAH